MIQQSTSRPANATTTDVVDAVYEKLLVVTVTDAKGNTVERERKTTVNHAMKSCRRAAALLAWEWLQRESDIFGTFDVNHYRPKERPNTVRVLHEKTGEENWVPLFDEAGLAVVARQPCAVSSALCRKTFRRPCLGNS